MTKLNKYIIIGLVIFISILFNILISYLSHIITAPPLFMPKKSKIALFFDIVIIAPFIETFIFQFLVIEFSIKYISNKSTIPILLSALLFAIPHYFNDHNLSYSFFTFLMGTYFAAVYLMAKKRQDLNPFFVVFLAHFSVNLLYYLFSFA